MTVERAATGEAPSSPQPPEAEARRARLYGVLPAAKGGKKERKAVDRLRAVAVQGRSNLYAGRNGQQGSLR